MSRTYNVIDSDGHVLEPPDFWVDYIDPQFRDRAPQLKVDTDGKERLLIEGRMIGGAKGLGFAGAIGARQGAASQDIRYVEGRKGGFDPHARIPDMDLDGIDAAFLYPTLGLLSGAISDPPLAAAVCRAYNCWLADYCKPYPDRLNRMLGHPAYDPFWTEAQELDFAIGIHEGTGGMPAAGVERFAGPGAKHIVSHTVEMMLASLSVIWEGVCERFPKLRFAFLESGGGWVAAWLDRMDRHYDDNGVFNDSPLRMLPSEYFQRQCWISFEPVEGSLSHLVNYLGAHKILWATDYPHPDGFFPGAPKMIAEKLPETARRQVLAESAMQFYKLN